MTPYPFKPQQELYSQPPLTTLQSRCVPEFCRHTLAAFSKLRTIQSACFCAQQRFEKLHALTLYMPPWHWDEVQAAIPVYPHNGKALAEQLFKQYGGIASAVLARGHLPAPFSPLQSALSTANPSPILQQVGGPCRKVCPPQPYVDLATALSVCLSQSRCLAHTAFQGLVCRVSHTSSLI